MARKTVLISDKSGRVIEEGRGATVRVSFHDARRGVYELDVTQEEAEQIGDGGRKTQRRGRKPSSV